MESKSLIGTITIPNYLKQIQVSKAQRERYYEWNGITIKCGHKKLLKKYILSDETTKRLIIENNGNVTFAHLKENYTIVGFKGTKAISIIDSYGEEYFHEDITASQAKKPTKYILCEMIEDGIKTYSMIPKKVIANETKAGKPRFHIIKGQDFYVGLNPYTRNKLVNELKYSYYEVLKDKDLTKLRQRIKLSYPLYIEMEILDTITNQFGIQPLDKSNPGTRWDVGNRADPYLKTFLDFLTNGYTSEDGINHIDSLIEDDDRLHISSGNNAYFTPIRDNEVPTIKFYIYKDDRKLWGYWFNKFKLTWNV